VGAVHPADAGRPVLRADSHLASVQLQGGSGRRQYHGGVADGGASVAAGGSRPDPAHAHETLRSVPRQSDGRQQAPVLSPRPALSPLNRHLSPLWTQVSLLGRTVVTSR